ncbi:hypothetical protein RRG08_025600 [Elysia crispata]|uniref:Uncharacterized protein n=1 Tax=Elysia crispata TaxID=231223 RepID=A0AAE0YF64_9GAST|nr:hypothetical protein RRG08_025600 [Elysia crispata]
MPSVLSRVGSMDNVSFLQCEPVSTEVDHGAVARQDVRFQWRSQASQKRNKVGGEKKQRHGYCVQKHRID